MTNNRAQEPSAWISSLEELMNINHHDVRILDRCDSDKVDVPDRGPVPGANSHAVHVDHPRRRNEVGEPQRAKHVFGGLANLQFGLQHAGASPDGQGLAVIFKAARNGHETPGRIRRTWLDAPGRCLFEVVFGMADTGAGTQYLNASGLDSALAAEAVAVRDGPFTNVGDDFD